MIEIKKKQIRRNGKPFRSLTGDLEGCNTVIKYSLGFVGNSNPWNTFDQKNLNQQFKENFTRLVKGLNGKVLVAGVFSGKLLTTASRKRDVRSKTVWHPDHGAPGIGSDSVQDTFFTNPAAIEMQRKLIDFIIDTLEKNKVEAVMPFLWEAEVVKRNRNFLPWLYSHMKYVRKKAPWLPIGIHIHHSDIVSTVEAKIKNIFWFQECYAWPMVELDELTKIAPGIVGGQNPRYFSPQRPHELFEKGWEKVVQDAQEIARTGLIKLGTAGTLYKRWINEREARGDIEADKQYVLDNYNFGQVKKLMTKFYVGISRELIKYKDTETLPSDFGKKLLWHPPEEKPKPVDPPPSEPKPVEEEEPQEPELPPQPTEKKKLKLKVSFSWGWPYIHIYFKSFFKDLWNKYKKNWKAWLVASGLLAIILMIIAL